MPLLRRPLLRSLYRGIETHVIDPEDEYARLAGAVGGTYVHLGGLGVRLNPFDLPIRTHRDGRRTAPKDALIRRCLFLHTVISVLIGTELGAGERAALDAGSPRPTSRWGSPPMPALGPVRPPRCGLCTEVLAASQDPATGELAARLQPARNVAETPTRAHAVEERSDSAEHGGPAR